MSAEPRLTPLGLAALELLHEKPMHPYEMHQTLRFRNSDRIIKLKAGSLYHAVDRLARLGMIEVAETSRGGRRPERTLYRITDAGRQAYAERVSQMLANLPEAEYPEFPLALALGDDLGRNVFLDGLRERLAQLERVLQVDRQQAERLRSIRLPERYALDLRYTIAMRDAERRFVAELIDDIETGRLDWEVAEPWADCQTPTGPPTGPAADDSTTKEFETTEGPSQRDHRDNR